MDNHFFEDTIKKIRSLEQAAKKNPGIEESHDHVESNEYSLYKKEWNSLILSLQNGTPSLWLQVSEWCDHNNEFFGDADWAGVHKMEMNWNDDTNCMAHSLLIAIFRRSKNSSSEKAMWQNEQALQLLKNSKWLRFPMDLANVLIELKDILPELITYYYPDPLKELLSKTILPPGWFEEKLKSK